MPLSLPQHLFKSAGAVVLVRFNFIKFRVYSCFDRFSAAILSIYVGSYLGNKGGPDVLSGAITFVRV